LRRWEYAGEVSRDSQHIGLLDCFLGRSRGGHETEYDEPEDFSRHHNAGNASHRGPGSTSTVLYMILCRVSALDFSASEVS
jgi:hypothetical protein